MMDSDWLWDCFAATGNIILYMTWKEEQKNKEKGDPDGFNQSAGDRDCRSCHG